MSAVSVTKMEPQQALMIATVACVCLHVRVNALLVLWAHKLGFFFFSVHFCAPVTLLGTETRSPEGISFIYSMETGTSGASNLHNHECESLQHSETQLCVCVCELEMYEINL